MGSVGSALTVFSLSGDQAALATCCGTDFGCVATVCCSSDASFSVGSFLGGSSGIRPGNGINLRWQALLLAATIDPVVAECAPRSSVVGSAEATCVFGADFIPNKPNNLLANEPSLSGGGGGRDADGGTLAGGKLPPIWARKTPFIPPIEPAMNWGDCHVGYDQFRVLDLVGVLLL